MLFCSRLLRGSAKAAKGATRTYYDVLLIERTVKQAEVKKAFRKLAKEYHPDRNKDPEAEIRFKEIQEAYSTLGNQWKRALYDQDMSFAKSEVTGVDREEWTRHWGTETEEERIIRTERYKRYANGERNDLPPDPFPFRVAVVTCLGIIGGVFWFTANAPNLVDQQDAAHYNDLITGDAAVKLVDAYFDPWTQNWVRAPSIPTIEELKAFYRIDPPCNTLPKELTKMRMPRTTTHAPKWSRSKSSKHLVLRMSPNL